MGESGHAAPLAFLVGAGIALVAGCSYVRLALYAFTFGAYGAHLFGHPGAVGLRIGLSAGVYAAVFVTHMAFERFVRRA